LNGKIYTLDESIVPTITDLSLLDTFIEDYESASELGLINQFTNTNGSASATRPTITGEMYVNNADGEAIAEDELTSVYGLAWPQLTIRAAKIKESYLAKYIQIDPNTNKEIELDVVRYNPDTYTGQPIPEISTKATPYRQYYDFIGWAFEPDGELAYDISTNSWTALGQSKVFSAEQSVITLYAVFTQTLYTIEYYNPDGTLFATQQTTYGRPIPALTELPIYAPNDLEEQEIYYFKGYTRDIANALPSKNKLPSVLLDLSRTSVTEDNVKIYLVYIKQNVHDEATDLKYFVFEPASYNESATTIIAAYQDASYNVANGYKIDLNPDYVVSGKITLPSYYNGLPVITLGNSFTKYHGDLSKDITHIFWKSSSSEPCTVRTLAASSRPTGTVTMKLEYVEIPEGVRTLGNFFFQGFQSIKTVTPVAEGAEKNSIILPSSLALIGSDVFNNAFATGASLIAIKVPEKVCSMGVRAFGNMYASVESFEIGTSDGGSDLVRLDSRNLIENTGSIGGQIYNHNAGSTNSLTFYYKTTAQYNGFLRADGNFSNIMSKSYIQVG